MIESFGEINYFGRLLQRESDGEEFAFPVGWMDSRSRTEGAVLDGITGSNRGYIKGSF